MSFPLFKLTLRQNWLLLVFIIFLLLMYIAILIGMYNPGGAAGFDAMLDLLPDELLSVFGFDGGFNTLTGYLGSFYFGFLIIIFPMIYTIITANKMIASDVDRGSIAYLLVSPNTRIKIALTRAIYFLLSLLVMFFVVFIAGITAAEAGFPGQLDVAGFTLLTLCAFLVLTAVGGIGFFFSCIARDTRQSLTFGAGIPILFLFVKMVSGINPSLNWLSSFSIFALLDTNRILADSGFALMSCLISAAIILSTFGFGIFAFHKRDLSA